MHRYVSVCNRQVIRVDTWTEHVLSHDTLVSSVITWRKATLAELLLIWDTTLLSCKYSALPKSCTPFWHFPFTWTALCGSSVCDLPPHNAVLLLLSHMPIPSERFSSVPQFTGRMRLGICPPEHQGKATIPEMSSSSSLLVSPASPQTHSAHSFHYNDPSLRPSRLRGSVDDYRSHLFPNGC